MKKVIYFIRHAEQYKEIEEYQSDDNEQIKNEKIVLSVKGEKQASELLKIKELKKIDAVYSSSYTRAMGTAKYICENNNVKLRIDSRLNERKLGNNEELKNIGKNKKYRYVEEQLLDKTLKTTDGECAKDVSKRFCEFIEEVLKDKEKENIAIVSHGGALRFYLMNWCDIYMSEEKVNLKYNDNIINFNSPGVIKTVFEDEKLKQMENIL